VVFVPAPMKWLRQQSTAGHGTEYVPRDYRKMLPTPIDLVTSTGEQIAPVPGKVLTGFWA
jgi:hypothetical protein